MLAVFGVSALYERLPNRRVLRSVVVSALLVAMYVAMGAYSRALTRNVHEVVTDTQRLPIDLLTEQLRTEYTKFGVVESAISARSNPRKGRFNVEGIYRETLKPDLLVVTDIRELMPESQRVYLVKEESLSMLPAGWSEIGRLPPFASRRWTVVAVVYSSQALDNESAYRPKR